MVFVLRQSNWGHAVYLEETWKQWNILMKSKDSYQTVGILRLTGSSLFEYRQIKGTGYTFGKAILSYSFSLPSENGSTLKGKNKFFLFRVDSFSEGTWSAGKQTWNHTKYFTCKNWQQIYQVYQVPLRAILLLSVLLGMLRGIMILKYTLEHSNPVSGHRSLYLTEQIRRLLDRQHPLVWHRPIIIDVS